MHTNIYKTYYVYLEMNQKSGMYGRLHVVPMERWFYQRVLLHTFPNTHHGLWISLDVFLFIFMIFSCPRKVFAIFLKNNILIVWYSSFLCLLSAASLSCSSKSRGLAWLIHGICWGRVWNAVWNEMGHGLAPLTCRAYPSDKCAKSNSRGAGTQFHLWTAQPFGAAPEDSKGAANNAARFMSPEWVSGRDSSFAPPYKAACQVRQQRARCTVSLSDCTL